ncbi:MAG: 4-hydroxythreonine-4-phosphate dehydrogenase PdxA [Limnochordia bacterium]|jgi:4-hydroxythreonine-4-phosphate dehydrogenase|nr:4-hydroxythreonine-4-phosphate dehydrogenase PdxA [Bacillota bacterium]
MNEQSVMAKLMEQAAAKGRPIVAVSTGDPSGIGPEISVSALRHEEVYRICRPFLIGDSAAFSSLDLKGWRLNPVEQIGDMQFRFGTIDLLNMNLLPSAPPLGVVNAESGNASFHYVKKAIDLAMANEVDATVTGPISKEAINLAGHHFSGHTEIYAHYTNSEDYAMVLAHEHFRVIHVSTHVSLRRACDLVKKGRVLKVIQIADQACRRLGIAKPRIAVAGLNPHAGENGLFGTEEITEIMPAIAEARELGIDVDGPIPPDTVFPKLNGRLYDICVCMYHDQGHIPTKLLGFTWDPAQGKWLSVSGVNITMGLPIIRVSVDHGTAYDIAGKGVASDSSMVNAIAYAVQLALNR